jgi:hypothetical protein
MVIIKSIPLSLQELLEYYRISSRECKFMIKLMNDSLKLLDARMKPSAYVSSQFNHYEAYYLSFLAHLQWRLSPICVDESLQVNNSKNIKALLQHEYQPSGIAHPIDEKEIKPLLKSLKFVQKKLINIEDEIIAIMLKSIFMCHSTKDKDIVRKIALELTIKGAKVWFDEAEIMPGDSIIEKIQEGIDMSDYFGIILSPRSVESIWVRKEVESALYQEIEIGRNKVIPILIEPCDIPLFIKPKKYVDLTKSDTFIEGIDSLVKRLSN